MNNESHTLKRIFALVALSLFAFIIFGLIWFFFLGSSSPVGFGWYLFSFASGLTMIVLPCTLPLAFVIVPLSMGKGAGKGLGIAIAFGLGVAITLSLYGVIAAVVGEVAIGTLGAPLETVKNWLYFVAGIFAYLFALGEIGLIRFRMPSYTGAAPAFIQRQQDYLKALLLGLFLGNIGVGCPHPATPIILTRIAATGDVFYGWSLFFIHALGRVLPLLLLAILGILGVNALSWLLARKEKVERATGWGMVFVAGFILILGLFTHDWWVYSGQHTLFEEITREERVVGVIAQKLGTAPPHAHVIPTGTGLFGLPLWLGSWILVALWILPIWWQYIRSSKFKVKSEKLEEEQRYPTSDVGQLHVKLIRLRFWFAAALTAFLVVTFILYLPLRFQHQAVMHKGEPMMGEAAAHHHGAARYHEEGEVREGLVVNMNITPVPVLVGVPTRLDFFVNRKPGNVPVPVSSLELEHTKLMHVIGVRSDLAEFFHIHPEAVAPTLAINGVPLGLLSVYHAFTKPGLYKIWSEIKKDGVNHTFGHPEINVKGGGEREEKQISFGRNMIVNDYQVSLTLDEPVVKGHEHELTFDIHTLTGQGVEVEPFLAADMHLAIIKDDLKTFIHTHPEGHETSEGKPHSFLPTARAHGLSKEGPLRDALKEDKEIVFQAIFPESGVYKLFAQFRPKGISLSPDEALIATFWVKVEEKASFSLSSNWWVNLSFSLVLIVILSWGVKKFLGVKA